MKKHLTFLTAFVLFSATVTVNAQLPAGVVFDGYKLEKRSTQTPPKTGEEPYGWDETFNARLNSPDLDDLNPYHTNKVAAVDMWLHDPSSLFAADVPYMWVGGFDKSDYKHGEAYRTTISGLEVDTSYTYSFVATANSLLSHPNAESITIGIYFNDVLMDSQLMAVGEMAARRYFTFDAPATSGELTLGIVSVVRGAQGFAPWWQIAGGSGEFTLTELCNAGTAQVPLDGNTLTNQ